MGAIWIRRGKKGRQAGLTRYMWGEERTLHFLLNNLAGKRGGKGERGKEEKKE